MAAGSLSDAQEADFKALASDLAHTLGKTSKRPAAVIDFTDLGGNATLLGRYFAEELETALENTGGGIDLVDRTRLQLILQENKLASKEGLIDPATARKLGNIAGVQVLITGTITPLEGTIRLSVKALDTEDARVLAALAINIPESPAIAKLLSQGPAQTTAYASGPSAQQDKAVQTVYYRQYRFDLRSCERAGASLDCNLWITNRSGDQDLSLYTRCDAYHPGSRLIDSDGRELPAAVVSIGSRQTTAGATCAAKSTLVSGTRTRAKLSFQGFPADSSSIALLEIQCQEGPNENVFSDLARFKVQFRNISIDQTSF